MADGLGPVHGFGTLGAFSGRQMLERFPTGGFPVRRLAPISSTRLILTLVASRAQTTPRMQLSGWSGRVHWLLQLLRLLRGIRLIKRRSMLVVRSTWVVASVWESGTCSCRAALSSSTLPLASLHELETLSIFHCRSILKSKSRLANLKPVCNSILTLIDLMCSL